MMYACGGCEDCTCVFGVKLSLRLADAASLLARLKRHNLVLNNFWKCSKGGGFNERQMEWIFKKRDC